MEKYLEGESLTQEEVEGLLAKAIAHRLFVPVFAGSCVKEQGVNSDELMEKYLEGESLTQEEVEGLLAKAIAHRLFVPVFAGSCVKEQGVNSLMDDVATYFPAPTDYGEMPLIDGDTLKISTYFPAPTDYGEMPLIDGDTLKISSEDDRPVVFDFKTLNDAQQGRLSFLKVLTGTIEPGMELVNARTRKGERLAHLYVMCGHEMTEVGHAYAGDIVVVPKMSAETGDTLSVTGKVEAAAFKFPNSQYRIAIEAENRSDEDKLFTFISTASPSRARIAPTRISC